MTEFEEAFAEVFADACGLGGEASVVFRGATFTGLLTELTEDEKLQIGGAVPGVKQTLIFPRRAFTPPPRTGELVVVGGRRFNVGQLSSDEVSTSFLLCDPDA